MKSLLEWIRFGPRLANTRGAWNASETICVRRSLLWRRGVKVERRIMPPEYRTRFMFVIASKNFVRNTRNMCF